MDYPHSTRNEFSSYRFEVSARPLINILTSRSLERNPFRVASLLVEIPVRFKGLRSPSRCYLLSFNANESKSREKLGQKLERFHSCHVDSSKDPIKY